MNQLELNLLVEPNHFVKVGKLL